MKLYLVLLLPFLMSSLAPAQINESLLSGKGSGEKPTESGLQSGRYKKKGDENSSSQQQVAPLPKIIKAKQKSLYKKAPASVEGENKPTEEKVKTETSEKDEFVEPSFSEQVKDIFNGGQARAGDIYREQVHSDDIRLNRMEISIASGVFQNNSAANYSYRSYISNAPILSAGATLWLSPLIGVSGNYISSFGEDVASTTNASNRVAVRSEWFELSLDVRKFYGLSRRANNLQYGLIYSEYKFFPPADEATRVKLKSTGVGLYIKARVPVSPSYAWTFGGDVIPMITHVEIPTALSLQSGSGVSSSRVGVSLGGELKFNRQNQVVWTLGLKGERNLYSGAANTNDPATGSAPTGVSVTNTWTYFNLGYRWGQ